MTDKIKRNWRSLLLGIPLFLLLVSILTVDYAPKLWAYYQYQAGSRDCWGVYQGTGDQTGFTETQKRFVVYIEDSATGEPLVVSTLGPDDVFWVTEMDVGVSVDGIVIVFSGVDAAVDPGEFLNWANNASKNQASSGDVTYVTAPKTIRGTFPKVDTTVVGDVLVTFRGRTNYSP